MYISYIYLEKNMERTILVLTKENSGLKKTSKNVTTSFFILLLHFNEEIWLEENEQLQYRF